MLIGIAAALGAGVARALARTANAQTAMRVGVARSTMYSFAVGLMCSAVLLAVAAGPERASLLSHARTPPWAYLGGIVGVLFVAASSVAARRMSTFALTLLILAGQILAGVALDALIHARVAPMQVVGGILLLAGLLWDGYDRRRCRTEKPDGPSRDTSMES